MQCVGDGDVGAKEVDVFMRINRSWLRSSVTSVIYMLAKGGVAEEVS